jgi:quercetin dioxygenase-like cupin family protein
MKRTQSSTKKELFKNEIFGKILYTNRYLQVVVLRLNPGSVIGLKTNTWMDQYFGFEGAEGKCIVEGHEYNVESGDVIIIPASSGNEAAAVKCHKKALDSHKLFTSDKKDGFIRMTVGDLVKD